MFRQFLLALALAVALSSAAEVYNLPVPKPNYRTFSQSVIDAPKASKPTDFAKQTAKELKAKLNAKKVDIITLANGQFCIRAINDNGFVALYNTSGENLGAPFALPWSTELNLVQIKGDDKNYYFEGIAVLDETKPQRENYIKTTDGKTIDSGFTNLVAFKIDGNVYFQAFNKKYSTYDVKAASPYRELPYQPSRAPFYYVTLSDALTATETVDGHQITLPTMPHGAYFGAAGGIRVYLYGPKVFEGTYGNNFVMLKNSGYDFVANERPNVTAATTTGIVNGEEKTGTLLTVAAAKSNSFIQLTLLGPDGQKLLENCQSISISEPDQMLYYRKKNENHAILMGAKSLTDTTLQVPPKFANVQRAINAEGNGVWLVARKAFAPLEIYDPDADYTPVYRNQLEEDYNNSFYAKVRSDLNEPLSYEDLLLGLSAYTIDVTDGMPDVEKIVAQYRTGKEPEGMNDENSLNRLHISLLELSYNPYYLDEYCQRLVAGAPRKDKEIAQRVADEAQATHKKAEKLLKVDLQNARNDYNELIAQRRIDKEKADALAAKRAKEAAAREAQLRAERQQAIALAFLNGLGNLMQSTMSGSSRSSHRGTAVSTGRGSASMPSASSSSSSGGSGKVDNSGRKAFLKGQIIEWKNKAKKAEASYEQALSSGDDSWQKKNVIDSKRRSVDEALEMVRQYEAELNSLK